MVTQSDMKYTIVDLYFSSLIFQMLFLQVYAWFYISCTKSVVAVQLVWTEEEVSSPKLFYM